MAVETLYATSHLAGDFTNPSNAVGNTPSTWAGNLNENTNRTSRWAIDNPVLGLTGTQTINVRARKGSNSGTPTIAINLYENGVLVGSILAATNVTSTSGQTLTGTFSAASISNRNNVEIEVVMTSAGGSPSTRNSAQVAYIEWVANVSGAATVTPGVVAAPVAVPTPTVDTGGGGSATPGYVELSGNSGSYVDTPDSGGEVTGDVEIITCFQIGSLSTYRGVADKLGDNAGYRLLVWTDGSIQFGWGDGTSTYFKGGGAGTVTVDNDFWLRATLDVSTGAWEVFYSTDDPSTAVGSISWTSITSGTQATSAVAANTKNLNIGLRDGGGQWPGRTYCLFVYENGTLVASPDFRDGDQTSDSGATFVDDQTNTWTVQGDAAWVEPVGGGGAATVSPAAVAAVGAVPTPTLSVPATVTPATASSTTAVPQPTATAPGAANPASVSSTSAVPTPDVAAGASPSPGTVPATATVPDPTPSAPGTGTPDAVPATTNIPTPAATAPAAGTPATVDAPATVPSPTPTAPGTVTPAEVAATSTVPTPDLTSPTIVTVDPVAGTVTVEQATVAAASTVTPATVDTVGTVPTPSPAAASAVSPGTVTVIIAAPGPSVTVEPTVTPATVTAVVAVDTPDLEAAAVVTVTEVAATVAVPTPTADAGAAGTVSPAAVAAAATVPDPTASGAGEVTPDPVAATSTVPQAAISAAATVAPSVLAALTGVPTPTIDAADAATATPDPVAASSTVPGPSLSAASSVTPLAVAVVVTVPAPTVDAASAGSASPDPVAASSTVPGPSVTGAVAVDPDLVRSFVAVFRPTILGKLVALTRKQACRFFRNTTDTRLALMPLGRSQARGLRTADWETCSGIFVLNAGDEEAVMGEMAAVWAANQAADQATLTAAIDTRLHSLGYRGVGGKDLT